MGVNWYFVQCSKGFDEKTSFFCKLDPTKFSRSGSGSETLLKTLKFTQNRANPCKLRLEKVTIMNYHIREEEILLVPFPVKIMFKHITITVKNTTKIIIHFILWNYLICLVTDWGNFHFLMALYYISWIYCVVFNDY